MKHETIEQGYKRIAHLKLEGLNERDYHSECMDLARKHQKSVISIKNAVEAYFIRTFDVEPGLAA